MDEVWIHEVVLNHVFDLAVVEAATSEIHNSVSNEESSEFYGLGWESQIVLIKKDSQVRNVLACI